MNTVSHSKVSTEVGTLMLWCTLVGTEVPDGVVERPSGLPRPFCSLRLLVFGLPSPPHSSQSIFSPPKTPTFHVVFRPLGCRWWIDLPSTFKYRYPLRSNSLVYVWLPSD
ncbi:uncharacterized protein BDZ83DRAFT_622348 [Colletotrichum acutatum]|uniref:Uncharacterized protein n=1 Tax=Glomerella acutata TaxID=27357 RepID=A0AAD8UM90_GLOAC|nr:uncharacterized protein BDZ83DRAFT_622348 [Colletotrichum acutatum]KAK1724550.1 hypothetical protein BDZ83DRAFT_622348 [Colletotrichum acutatum]